MSPQRGTADNIKNERPQRGGIVDTRERNGRGYTEHEATGEGGMIVNTTERKGRGITEQGAMKGGGSPTQEATEGEDSQQYGEEGPKRNRTRDHTRPQRGDNTLDDGPTPYRTRGNRGGKIAETTERKSRDYTEPVATEGQDRNTPER